MIFETRQLSGSNVPADTNIAKGATKLKWVTDLVRRKLNYKDAPHL